MTIADAIAIAGRRLRNSSSSAQLDSQILLSHTLKTNRAYLYTHPQQLLSAVQQQQFEQLLDRRDHGDPIAYIVGQREFWSLNLMVNASVLIPRSDTELLVETVLSILPYNQPLHIADLGTGSGAIGLALAHERPQWHITASDNSEAALKVAAKNKEQLRLANIKFVHSDWYQSLNSKKFDAIVSNPPYIVEQDPHLQQGDLRFEPQNALRSGKDGLNAIRTLITNAAAHLQSSAPLLIEHGYQQAPAVQNLFKQQNWQDIQTLNDLAGKARLTMARLPRVE